MLVPFNGKLNVYDKISYVPEIDALSKYCPKPVPENTILIPKPSFIASKNVPNPVGVKS